MPAPLGSHGRFLFDSPSMMSGDSIWRFLSADERKTVLMQERIKPAVFRLIPGKSLVFGNSEDPIARFDFVEGGQHLLFTTFVSEELHGQIHATSIDAANHAAASSKGRRAHTVRDFDMTVSRDFNWHRAVADVSFPGVGWISVTGVPRSNRVRFAAHFIKGTLAPVLRPPIMPFESKEAVKGDVVKHGSVAAFKRRAAAAATAMAEREEAKKEKD